MKPPRPAKRYVVESWSESAAGGDCANPSAQHSDATARPKRRRPNSVRTITQHANAMAVSVRLLFIRKRAFLDVRIIAPDGIADGFGERRIVADKTRVKLFRESEHVVHDEDLSIAVGSGSNADRGDFQHRGHFRGQRGGDFFEDDR